MTDATPVRDYIRTIPDFPHAGIMFRDVTTLFADPQGLRRCIDELVAPYRDADIDMIAGIEARGFVIGGAMADRLGAGFLPIRKAGKLPGRTISEDYALEYGQATVEVHDDAIAPGARVLLVDDLLATGGTAAAGLKLLSRLGAQVMGCAFVVDLPELGGRRILEDLGHPVHILCEFAGA
ncbi:adenine phosphoribosyltransferase [Mesobaculum littorinae]|uniref:Adenine phosphoribosyltransferase n=1 Tax=Mesobaculum littorinae TaxID=2486419 RepID=A0A438AIN2_9RHOB|nr:adenine phosphoribosyltransferase [Mesobaculum littorinae]RVV98546.1 adenine phosphoribosyltransferase [Mesobaculum littorinae]